MALDSLSESSLVRLQHYLSSNPYREYSMNKPYFPKPPPVSVHTNRLFTQNQPPILAFHELIDTQKNALTLDRLAYKLRMKSDLNIDTLRETHMRRRCHQRSQHHLPPQAHQNPLHSINSDSLSSIPPSTSTKTFTRQPTSITMSSNTMKTLMNDDLNGIEGNAVRVGTLNDLIKQFHRAEFRFVRRPANYLDSSSANLSSNISTNDQTITTKSHHQQSERTVKQPQALTEYRFNVPTFPTTLPRTTRDPTVHQGLIYQYRTRERIPPTELPLLNPPSIHSPDQYRQRINSLVIHQRHPTSMSLHERRIQELREKSLMRTEKQLCVCNKLTIVDPFSSSSEQIDSTLPHLQQVQSQLSANYIFPPVRPFGNLTKKSTDDLQQSSWTQPSTQHHSKKKQGTKKKRHKNSKNSFDSLDKIAFIEPNDDDDTSQVFNENIQSMVSLTEMDDDAHNKTINVDLNIPRALTQTTDEQEQ